MTRSTGNIGLPLDEVLQLHQTIGQLELGIRNCKTCSLDDEVLTTLLDGLAGLFNLYEVARPRHAEHGLDEIPGCSTAPSVTLGRLKLSSDESNLVAGAIIKQGLSQTGLHLRDLQQCLTRSLTSEQMARSSYDLHKRRVSRILESTYSSLATAAVTPKQR